MARASWMWLSLLWTLAHAHGVLLALLVIAFLVVREMKHSH